MLLLLALVLYLTVEGANVPSAFLSTLFARMESALSSALRAAKAAPWLVSALCEGVLRVLGWVVAVMLPPMAIFFPLFTLLEDLGYLPRVAFNLDRCFNRCRACGKQALTMCMGLGCNAVGVVGCRIIDSPRERLIAILTNAFMPCNGRFPLLIALVSLFLAPSGPMAALMLAGLIVLAVCITLAACRALSATLLRGMPSAFTLELPPLRRPQVGRVIVRSILDRTLHVLSRAVVVAAPAGLVIWALANIEAHGASLLTHGVRFLDPFARVLGLDGAILMAFVLAFPANEIVLPLAMMAYLSAGTLAQPESAQALGALFRAQGWTWLTALNTILFSMMHWPCSTTVLTIARETRSVKWTLTAVLLPTACGMTICALITLAARALRLA
ncbi:MAG TPA: ferrous iron transporter B [Candidatus Pullichristensenella avicola]|nr:ferrous iron transporter B [Candidatus Pullichristensenella avicola]